MKTKSMIRALVVAGVVLAGIFRPNVVKADALPCTVMYLEQAQGMKATAEAEVKAAQSVYEQKKAVVDQMKAAGNTAGLDYLNAVAAMDEASRMVDCKKSAVYNAENFIKDCKSKYAVEDAADKSFKALQDLNVVQSCKLDYDNAMNIAAQASNAVEATKNAIAGYKVQLASSPALQAQIDSLAQVLASQEADLAAKLAVVSQKKAAYESSLNSNYAQYDKRAIDYIYARDNARDTVFGDLNENGLADGDDFFIGIGWKNK